MLYYLVNETILWSEDVYFEKTIAYENEGGSTESDYTSYRFDATKTVVLTPMRKGNSIELNGSKLSEGMFKPKIANIPISSIVMITDCTDERVITQIKATLSGIILPGKN